MNNFPLAKRFSFILWFFLMGVPGPAFAGVDDAFLKSVFEGERKETESLLQLGADIEARTNKGSTALIVAAARGHTSLVELLLNQGAKVNAQNRYDDTALLLCATLGDVKCMNQLIANGANVNSKNMHGWSPLSRCARYGHLPALRTLVEQGAKIDIRLNDGATPLIISAGEQHSGAVRFLSENGADPNAQNLEKTNAIFWLQEERTPKLTTLIRSPYCFWWLKGILWMVQGYCWNWESMWNPGIQRVGPL